MSQDKINNQISMIIDQLYRLREKREKLKDFLSQSDSFSVLVDDSKINLLLAEDYSNTIDSCIDNLIELWEQSTIEKW